MHETCGTPHDLPVTQSDETCAIRMQGEDEAARLWGCSSCRWCLLQGVWGCLRCDGNGFGVYSYFVKGHVKDMRRGSMETISHVVGKIAAVVGASIIPNADADLG